MDRALKLMTGLRMELRGRKYVREAAKLHLRALIHSGKTRRWLALLNSHPVFRSMLPANPRLVNKIYRDYFSTHLSCSERLDALHFHYTKIIGEGWSGLATLAARHPVVLAHMDGRAPGSYQLVLRAGDLFQREGELVLQLVQQRQVICSAAFSFMRTEGEAVLAIGAIQGTSDAGNRELIRDATHSLHGVRPKHLLVRALQQLAAEHGCAALHLVSNRNRVVTVAARKGKVHADYDGFWRELGALEREDRNFSLPASALGALDLENTPSRKRAEARRRHAMLAQAFGDMLRTIGSRTPLLVPMPVRPPVLQPAPQLELAGLLVA